MRAFDLIIFDFDGTVADSAVGIAACMRAAFDSFQLTPPADADVRARIGLTLEESIRQLAPEADVAAVAARYRELHDSIAAPAATLFAGTDDVLRSLGATGMHLIVVSQKVRRGLRQLLTQFGITDRFDLILGADDVTAHKPDAALYERHIEPLVGSFRLKRKATKPHPSGAGGFRLQAEQPLEDLRRDRILVVGDTATDILFAMNIGAHSCWAAYGYGDEHRCSVLAPTFRISAISELPAICGS